MAYILLSKEKLQRYVGLVEPQTFDTSLAMNNTYDLSVWRLMFVEMYIACPKMLTASQNVVRS